MTTATNRRNALNEDFQMIANDTLYLCDNGACYCGAHLGTTARMTGRDRSGQEIMAVDAEMLARWDEGSFKCEKCGKEAQ